MKLDPIKTVSFLDYVRLSPLGAYLMIPMLVFGASLALDGAMTGNPVSLVLGLFNAGLMTWALNRDIESIVLRLNYLRAKPSQND